MPDELPLDADASACSAPGVICATGATLALPSIVGVGDISIVARDVAVSAGVSDTSGAGTVAVEVAVGSGGAAVAVEVSVICGVAVSVGCTAVAVLVGRTTTGVLVLVGAGTGVSVGSFGGLGGGTAVSAGCDVLVGTVGLP